MELSKIAGWALFVAVAQLSAACTSSDAGANGAGDAGPTGNGGAGAGGSGAGAAGAGGTNLKPSCPTFSKDAVPAGVTVLYDNHDIHILSLTGVVGDQVYFVDFDQSILEKMPIAGGPPTTVGPITSFPQLRGTDLLVWEEQSTTAAADASNTYRIVSAPLDNPSKINVIADNVGRSEQLIVDATNVYFESRTPENIFSVPLSGGAPQILVAGGAPLGTLVKDGYLWWLDFRTENLERIPVTGGTRERLGQVNFGGPMAGDANGVYWGDTSSEIIQKWTQTGGIVELSQAQPDQVVVADDVIYWTDSFVNGSVQSIRTDGTESKSILCGLETPDTLVITGNYIVVNVGQGILRIDR